MNIISLLPPEQRDALFALSGAAHINRMTCPPDLCDWCDERGATVTFPCHGDTLTMHPECRDQHLARFACAFHGSVKS